MSLIKIKNYNTKDTIAAIATFPSKSALGVIKISGKKSLSILHKIFVPRRNKDIRKAKTYTLHYGWIVTRPRQGKKIIIDEVLAGIMRKPHSYTCEDVVEVSCHGGYAALNKILEIILNKGARLALPGEFTYRAFLNGRINLLQAESVKSIVEAKSETALTAALSQLNSGSSIKLNGIKEDIKKIFLDTEASINFPEDDININLKNLENNLKCISKKIQDIIEIDNESRIIKEGLKCVICGKTNVGKSTLFNCLLKKERVIVSEIPGTTRDIIEETINIKGVPLRIFDTAGILTPRDLIEKKAIDNSSKIFNESDLIVLVLDGSRALDKDDLFLIHKIKAWRGKGERGLLRQDKNVIIIINKNDLKQKIDLERIEDIKGYRVKLSALKSEGITRLEDVIFKISYRKGIKKEDIIFLNAYQAELIKSAKDNIEEARQLILNNQKIDFINLALKNALDNLGRLTGEVFCEELLEKIFSDFCVGK